MSKYKQGDLAKNFIILLFLTLFSCKEKKAEFDERNLFFEITNKVDTSFFRQGSIIMMSPLSARVIDVFNRSEQSIYVLCEDTLMLDYLPNFTNKEDKYFHSQSGPFYIPKRHLMFLPKKSKISLYTVLHPKESHYAKQINFSYSMDTIFYKEVANKSLTHPHYHKNLDRYYDFRKDTILKRRQLLFIRNEQNIFEYKGIGKEIKRYDDTTLILPFPREIEK